MDGLRFGKPDAIRLQSGEIGKTISSPVRVPGGRGNGHRPNLPTKIIPAKIR